MPGSTARSGTGSARPATESARAHPTEHASCEKKLQLQRPAWSEDHTTNRRAGQPGNEVCHRLDASHWRAPWAGSHRELRAQAGVPATNPATNAQLPDRDVELPRATRAPACARRVAARNARQHRIRMERPSRKGCVGRATIHFPFEVRGIASTAIDHENAFRGLVERGEPV